MKTPIFTRILARIIGLLLAVGVCLSASGQYKGYALIEAAATGELAEVNRLIAEGADVNLANESGRTPLYYAARLGSFDIVEKLLFAGADVALAGKDGVTPLIIASGAPFTNRRDERYQNFLLTVSELIDGGANVNATADNGDSALFRAVNLGHLEIARMLILAGANVNVVGPNGLSPLQVAAIKEYPEIARILVVAGAE